MRNPRAPALILLVVLGLAGPALQAELPEGMAPLPTPDLGPVEAGLSARLNQARSTFEWLLDEPNREDSDLVDAYVEIGGLYLAAGLDEAADVCFANARRLAPEDARWSHLLGVLASSRGDLDAAEEHLRRALEQSPSSLATQLQMGQLLLVGERPEPAVEHFEAALEIDPRSAFAYFSLGTIAMTRANWAEAALFLEKALELQPEATSLHRPLGIAYRQLGEREMARAHLKKAGEASVEFADPIIVEVIVGRRAGSLARAVEARRQGDLDLAVGLYRQAISEAPEAPEHHRSLAAVLAAQGAIEEAIQEYEQAAALDPEHAGSQLHLAQLRVLSVGLDETSVNGFQRAIELAPTSKEALLGFARELAKAGRHEEALPIYERAVAVDPQDLRAAVQRARTLVFLRREAEAVTALQGVLDRDPRWARAHLDLGTILARLGDLEGAEHHLREALSLELNLGDELHAVFNLGNLRHLAGDTEGAISFYFRAVELDDTLRDAQFNLATALASVGRMGEAAAHFERVTELDPGDAVGWRLWARALEAAGRRADALRSLEAAVGTLPDDATLAQELARLRRQALAGNADGSG